MSNKIKIKKNILQYGYLQLEKQEVDDICGKVEKEIREFFEKEFPEEFKKLNIKKENQDKEQLEKTINESEEDIKEDSDEIGDNEEKSHGKNPDIKKIYRKIAERSHPDKIGDNTQADIFSAAVEAYKSNNVAKLLDLSALLNIEFMDLSEDTINILENNITSLNKYILTKKSSSGWSWHQSKCDDEKKKIIEMILKTEGII
jgi:hypothetical protein